MKKFAFILALLMVISVVSGCASVTPGDSLTLADDNIAANDIASAVHPEGDGVIAPTSYTTAQLETLAAAINVSNVSSIQTSASTNRNDAAMTTQEAMEGGNQMRILRTDSGTYCLYYKRMNMLRDNPGDGNTLSQLGLNEFRLVAVRDGTTTQIYPDYCVYDGLNMMADASGTVYFVTAASGRIYRPDLDEDAAMTVWKLNASNDRVVGYTTRLPFASNDTYNYTTALLDNTAEKMYVIFAGDTTIAWATFDLNTQLWEKDIRTCNVGERYDYGYAFSDNGKIILVGQNADCTKLAMFKIDDPTVEGLATTIIANAADGENIECMANGDAYYDNGSVYVVYKNGGLSYVASVGCADMVSTVSTTDIAAATAKKFAKGPDGKLYILTMPYTSANASLDIWIASSETNLEYQLVKTSNFATSVVMSGDGFSATGARNGSNNDVVDCFFGGTNNVWYRFSVTLPGLK